MHIRAVYFSLILIVSVSGAWAQETVVSKPVVKTPAKPVVKINRSRKPKLVKNEVLTAAEKRDLSILPFVKRPGIEETSSFCYVHRSKDWIDGQNVQQKVKIASVSKLFTSYYALRARGAEYRYPTQIHYDPKTKDLLIEGSGDPFMGNRVLHFIVSELNRLGIKQINHLYIDPKFAVYLDVEDTKAGIMWKDSKIPSEVRYFGRSPQRSVNDLKKFFVSLRRTYNETRNQARALGVQMQAIPQLQVKSVSAVSLEKMQELKNESNFQVYQYRSSPLIRLVKNMNNQSNNYAADQMVASLGGVAGMVRFLRQDLGLQDRDFSFVTGSGLWKNDPYVPDRENIRTDNARDNEATCEAVMNVLASLERYLKKIKLSMSDVVMVASQDHGSLNLYKVYRSEELSNAILAKTGTLAKATALAGELKAESGEYFFGIFFETANSVASEKAQIYRDQLIQNLMKGLGGKDPIEYKPDVFLPFDARSSLIAQDLGLRSPIL